VGATGLGVTGATLGGADQRGKPKVLEESPRAGRMKTFLSRCSAKGELKNLSVEDGKAAGTANCSVLAGFTGGENDGQSLKREELARKR